jgi:signal transduction histidine kinase
MSGDALRDFVPRSGRDRRQSLRWSLEAIQAFEDAREDERRRLARELHDDLGQALTGMKMDLFWLQSRLANPAAVAPVDVAAKLQMTMTLVDQCLHTVRSVISELRPKALDDLGLVGAMEWQVETFARRYGIRATFRAAADEVPLDNGRATAVFRMFQEMLTNVARHARATRVEATLERVDETLVVRVRDNGRGLPSESPARSGHGLLGMRERTLLLDGTFQIVAGKPRGTTIVVTIPLPNRRHAPRPPIVKDGHR